MMSNLKALRVALNTRVKSFAGFMYKAAAQRSWSMSNDEFWHYQYSSFISIYDFACRRVPYYAGKSGQYQPLEGGANDIRSLLQTLPVLTKEAVRENNFELWCQPQLPFTKIHTTSGTSGTPLRLTATIFEKGYLQAVRESWYSRICGNPRPRTMNLSGFVTPSKSELIWYDRFSGDSFLSIYSLNQANRDQVIRLFLEHDPQLIYGYASAVHQLALIIGEDVIESKNSRTAVVTSEVLHPHWRKDIEATLCRKVYDFYSSQEGAHAVMECPEGKMHINPLIGVVEIVGEDNQPVGPGEMGRVLVTGLVRKSMPLIRYEVGDNAISMGYQTGCACGSEWPAIGAVQGRSEDLVLTRDGRRIGYLCFHATKDLEGLKECQLVQVDYEKFVCNIVKDAAGQIENSYLERTISSQLVKRLQMNVEVEFNYLSSIPRGPQGKFKAVEVRLQKAG